MSTYGIPAPIKPQPWQVDALCAQVDPELWFPDCDRYEPKEGQGR